MPTEARRIHQRSALCLPIALVFAMTVGCGVESSQSVASNDSVTTLPVPPNIPPVLVAQRHSADSVAERRAQRRDAECDPA